MLSRGLNGKETGEGTGICPRDVLCIDCVRVLNGSFSASFLVGDSDRGCVLLLAFICVVFFIYFICVLHLLYVSAILFSAFIVFAFLIYFIYLPFCFLHLLCLFSSILFSCCPYLSMYVYIHIHSVCI